MFVLVFYKLMQTVWHGESTPGLLAILVRDSLLSYGGSLVFLLINTCIWALARVRFSSLVFLGSCAAFVLTGVFNSKRCTPPSRCECFDFKAAVLVAYVATELS